MKTTNNYAARFSRATNNCSTDNIIEVDPEKELRCPNCNKKILEGELGSGGSISHKCTRCKTICRFMKIP